MSRPLDKEALNSDKFLETRLHEGTSGSLVRK